MSDAQPAKPYVLAYDVGQVLLGADDDGLFKSLGDFGGGAETVAKNLAAFNKETAHNLRDQTFDDLLKGGQRHFGIRHGVTAEQFGAAWNASLTHMPEMETLLKQQAPRQRVVLASNTNGEHWRHIETEFPAVWNSASARYASYEMGVKKPDPRFYENILQGEGYTDQPQRIVFIDDKAENVEAARKAGMTGIVFTDKAQLVKDLAKLKIVSFDLAPMFDHTGAPKLDEHGKQVVRPFDLPVADNARIFAAQGTLLKTGKTGEPATALEIANDMADRDIAELRKNADPRDLNYWSTRSVVIVSADGDALIPQRSQRGASKGDCQASAGGFPKTRGDAGETPVRTALRELHEELGIRVSEGKLVDLGLRNFGTRGSSFALPAPDGEPEPGITVEFNQSFLFASRRTTQELLRDAQHNCESVGMSVVSKADAETLARGQPVEVRYVPSTIPFAQPILEKAAAHGAPLSLEYVRQEVRNAPPLTGAQRAEHGTFPPAEMVMATASPVVYGRPFIAAILGAFEATGRPELAPSPQAKAYLEEFRRDAKASAPVVKDDLGPRPGTAGPSHNPNL